MPDHEVFPNPTVEQVIFQVRFPRLFFLEGKMGDYQLKVMKEFPQASEIHARNILLAHLAPEDDEANSAESDRDPGIEKIWRFENDRGVILNVKTDSLDLSSTRHKTYKNSQVSSERFRDAIEHAVDALLEVAQIPLFLRVGLRYKDKIPPPTTIDNESLRDHYKTALPLDDFRIQDSIHSELRIRAKKGKHYLRFREMVAKRDEETIIELDFDGYAEKVDAEKYLEITDDLHEMIFEEWDNRIKEPVRELMRQTGGNADE
jgi:uncharacterized protein (TIGR04255 family)